VGGVPGAIGVPLISIMIGSGLRDTPTGLALAHTAISLPLCIWLLTSFFESIPIELEEAAQVDGANRMRILLSVIIPVVSGGIAVAAIFAFLASWNEFLFALLLTAVIVIANFQTQFGLQWGEGCHFRDQGIGQPYGVLGNHVGTIGRAGLKQQSACLVRVARSAGRRCTVCRRRS
jgi:ABC-type phosphate transport system permease subunit